jgi:nicotinamidase-related amidase
MADHPKPDYTRPDFSAMALITIDVQNDFLDGQPSAIPGTSQALPQMRKVAEAFRRARRPVIHMVRLYQRDGSNAELCRRAAFEKGAAIVCPGTAGAELAAPLLPTRESKLDHDVLLSSAIQRLGPCEWAIFKPRWGAFFQTPLQRHLADLGVTSLAFAGCNFPNCPRTSIYEASERDFRVVLVEDGVSGLYDRGREEMIDIGVTLLTSEQLARQVMGD